MNYVYNFVTWLQDGCRPSDGGSKHLWKVCKLLRDYIVTWRIHAAVRTWYLTRNTLVSYNELLVCRPNTYPTTYLVYLQIHSRPASPCTTNTSSAEWQTSNSHNNNVLQVLSPATQPLTVFPCLFYGSGRLMILFTKARHWTLPWARWIQEYGFLGCCTV
jgi:hypothetical protein